jgi:ADP-heptose:LPS heptosyltransferase
MLFSLLGSSQGKSYLARKVRKQTDAIPPFSFPIDVASVKNIFIILPPERLDTLYQLKNVIEMAAHFKGAAVTLLAEEGCVPFARMIDGATVVEYRRESKKLFSATFNGLNHDVAGTADLACLLTRDEDLPLLYLAGKTAAPIRVGYTGAGGSPFINLHIGPSADRRYLPEWNCAMAEILGARRLKSHRSSVAKATVEEIDQLLRDQRLEPSARLVGIDLSFFIRQFGAKWANGLMEACMPCFGQAAAYLYAEETCGAAEREKIAKHGLPLIEGLTLPQTAALAARSAVVVTGNSLLYGLATLVGAQAVGVFSAEEFEVFCPPQPAAQAGISFEKNPTAETIGEVVKKLSIQ